MTVKVINDAKVLNSWRRHKSIRYPAKPPDTKPTANCSATSVPQCPSTPPGHRQRSCGILTTAHRMGKETWSRCQGYGRNSISPTTRHGASLCGRMLDMWYGWTSEGPMPDSTGKSSLHQPTGESMALHMWYNVRTNQSGEHHPSTTCRGRSVWVCPQHAVDSRVGAHRG